LYGGKASTIYQIEYMLNPRMYHKYPWSSAGLSAWIGDMGVKEYAVYKENESKRGKDGRMSERKTWKTSPQEAPGATPLLLPETLDHMVFAGLIDMGSDMVDFDEEGFGVQMEPKMAMLYQSTEGELQAYMNDLSPGQRYSFASAYYYAMRDYFNYPFEERKVFHTRTYENADGEEYQVRELVATLPALDWSYRTNKEQELMQLVKDEYAAGRGMGIYLVQTGDPDKLQRRLKELVLEAVPDATVDILTSSVETKDRDAWIQEHQSTDVLICNPRLVQTGLDLLQFPTLVFYESPTSLYTTEQASRRAWRIPQTKPCKVKYMYWYRGHERIQDAEAEEGYRETPAADTMEARGVAIISQKRGAAKFFYGLGGNLTSLIGGGGDSLVKAVIDALDSDETLDLSDLFSQAAHDPAELASWYTDEGSDDDLPDFNPRKLATIAVDEDDAPEPAEEEAVVEDEPEQPEEPVQDKPVLTIGQMSFSWSNTQAAVETPVETESEESEPEPAPEPEKPETAEVELTVDGLKALLDANPDLAAQLMQTLQGDTPTPQPSKKEKHTKHRRDFFADRRKNDTPRQMGLFGLDDDDVEAAR